MQYSERLEEFKKSVNNKFNVYNSLFLNLPYRNIENVGMLIPLLLHQCQKGLQSGKNPQQILESFFQNYAEIGSEQDRINFMFRIIQYVERQVVLYDSVEDAAFPKLHEYSESLSIKDYFQLVRQEQELGPGIQKTVDLQCPDRAHCPPYTVLYPGRFGYYSRTYGRSSSKTRSMR